MPSKDVSSEESSDASYILGFIIPIVLISLCVLLLIICLIKIYRKKSRYSYSNVAMTTFINE